MSLLTYVLNETQVVKLVDEFDAAKVGCIRKQFEQLIDLECDILIDIKDVYFIDSSGLGAIVFLYKRLLSKGYVLTISGIRDQPAEIFSMLHLDKTIPCVDSIESFVRHDNLNQQATNNPQEQAHL